MQKKGLINLEALVKLLPHLAMTVLGIFVLASLITVFWLPKKSPAEGDFARIMGEVQDLVNAQSGRSITVPLNPQAKFNLLVQSPDSTATISPRCPAKTACMCVVFEDPEKKTAVERCEVLSGENEKIIGTEHHGFTGLTRCPQTCGGEVVCVPPTLRRFEINPGNSVVVERTCNELEIRVV